MSTQHNRRTLQVPSHGEQLDVWFYPVQSATAQKPPVIVMAHGLGGIKTMRLDAYAEAFSAQGIACLVFDYRFFGGSSGAPRGLIDIARQLEDWDTMIEYARTFAEVDGERIGLFGSSFSGGHVIKLAATHGNTIKATVSQCPFTDGISSGPTVGLTVMPKVAFLALKDLLWSKKDDPVRVPLVGTNGETALLNAHDCVTGYKALLPPGVTQLDVESVPARIGLWLSLYRPGTYASQVRSPIFFAICAKDTVAPAKWTLGFAKKAPKGVVKWYDDLGHFDIYVGEPFERVTKQYIDFYKSHLLAPERSRL